MRVVVNRTLCESNAVCMRLVPEVFEVRDDDRLYLKTERPPEALRARVDEAVRRCPKRTGGRSRRSTAIRATRSSSRTMGFRRTSR